MAEWWGVSVASESVCAGHSAPLDFLAAWVFDRPQVSVVVGPRGGGKSHLAALATHLDSQVYPGQGTRILGGSLAQSKQIYEALKGFDNKRPGALRSITKTEASYLTGSDVSILAASHTSVRGPHVPTLRLDEVDEIDDDIRDAAAGMCMSKGGLSASVSMTSTWHNVAGPMQKLKDQSDAGEFPWYSFCAFEVLERCPESRSGPYVGGAKVYENCPTCPIMKWCHDGSIPPKAKRSNGHYAIDALIQKTRLVSDRTFESDYLSLGPRAAGLWFPNFDGAAGGKHVRVSAEYDPRRPVIVAVDSGVWTAAVLFQVGVDASGQTSVNVFGDYLAENPGAERAALDIVALTAVLCQGRRDRVFIDPASASRNAVGPVVEGEYLRAGLKDHRGHVEHWPNKSGTVRASLDLIDALLLSADGTVSLSIHPRAKSLILAMQNYRRAKRAGQWMDYPEDPQSPWEHSVDALRSGVLSLMPSGRRPEPPYRSVPLSRLTY